MPIKVVIYGGNGFVGTHIAKALAKQDVCTVCVSRTGHKPLHLKDEKWSEKVRWCQGDASQPKADLLKSANVVICAVGSAPLPTLTQEAFEQQVSSNGSANVSAINAANDAGVQRLILLGAQIPWPLNTDKFGYAKGKRLAYEAAEKFASTSKQHRALVIQPGAIYGTRVLLNGTQLPLGLLMKPLSYLMPWQFISVQRIAERVVNEILGPNPSAPAFVVLKNSDI